MSGRIWETLCPPAVVSPPTIDLGLGGGLLWKNREEEGQGRGRGEGSGWRGSSLPSTAATSFIVVEGEPREKSE